MNKHNKKETRGGARQNAGRKPTGNRKVIGVRYDDNKMQAIRNKYDPKYIADKMRDGLDNLYKAAMEEPF